MTCTTSRSSGCTRTSVTVPWISRDVRLLIAGPGVLSAGLYNGLVANDHFIEDGPMRLRELSVAYTFGQNTMRQFGLNRIARGLKVALIGRNIYTWTDYTGFDPEVTRAAISTSASMASVIRTSEITGQVEIQF